GIRAWFEDVDEMYSAIEVDLGSFRELGNLLLVLGHMQATTRGTGDPVSTEVAWVVEPRGEKLQRGWAYGSHAERNRAATEAARWRPAIGPRIRSTSSAGRAPSRRTRNSPPASIRLMPTPVEGAPIRSPASIAR